METLTVALWPVNLEQPAPSLAGWLANVDARTAEAKAAGAEILVLPELACTQWLSFARPGMAPAELSAWLAAVADEAAPALREMAVRYGVALLPGSFPVAVPGETGLPRNQAWLFLPDGGARIQDKLCLTPSELGMFSPGTTVGVVHWADLRIAVVICLDVEFTALWARLGGLDLDLLLVPAKTDMVSGYQRVFGCAKARAIELQAAVCVVGATGAPLGLPALDTTVGGAAAYVPCDAGLSPDGVFAALEPHTAAAGLPPFLLCPHLPIGACRRIRHGGAEAEVWPGSWSAEGVAIADPAPAL
jgi:predicted amidohydrolase